MNTKSTVTPAYLAKVGAAIDTYGSPTSTEGDGSVPITDMYGYIIDMAFRTNAADSNLMLQVDAADRIYESNANGVENTYKDANGNEQTDTTMGKGANMTFTSTTNSFGNDKVLSLMSAIRIVFFNPDTKEVVATAKLNTAEGAYEVTSEGGIKADIQLYTMGTGTATDVYYTATVTDNDSGTTYTVYYTDDTKATEYCRMYKDADGNEVWGTYADGAFSAAADATTLKANIPSGSVTTTEVPSSDNKLMALTQNTAHKLSVLVYLDGSKVTNADVAATAATSVTGTMNLQFCSDANLVPMNYTPLQEVQGAAETTETTAATTAATEAAGG